MFDTLFNIAAAYWNAAQIHIANIWNFVTRLFDGVTEQSWQIWHLTTWSDLGRAILGQERGVLAQMFWPIVIAGTIFAMLTKLDAKHGLYHTLGTLVKVVIYVAIAMWALPFAGPFVLLLLAFIPLAMTKGIWRLLTLLAIFGFGACTLGSYVIAYWLVALLAVPILWIRPGLFTVVLVSIATYIAMTNLSVDWRLPLALVLAWTIYAWEWLPAKKH